MPRPLEKIIPVLLIWIVLFAIFAYPVLVKNQSEIYAEHGIIENLQVLILIFSLAIFSHALIRKKVDKIILLSLILLCLGFIIREVDFTILASPAFKNFSGRTEIALGILLIVVWIYAVINWKNYQQPFLSFLKSAEFLLLISAWILLYTGDYFFETAALDHHEFFEEMLELFGYSLILLTALRMAKYPLMR